ncbi:MAG: MucB/RseB C-terminal domain-containing protein [Woeseiaceae bacterium]|nr:MucB/RseB C-terminal domain-containing protein [Woeseiaceae bacterium]
MASNPAASLRLALCGLALVVPALSAAAESPGEWLQRMSNAVQTTDYEGTVIRLSNGRVEALKVVHAVSDGVVRERLIAQEGSGLEIIRNGNEVHCILPEQQSVLVEEWNDQSTLFSTLPSNSVRFGSEYDVSIVREDRVAGRKTVLIAIRPHDEYRFGHRIWLDTATGFPLQTRLIDEAGAALQEVKFADISLGREILASALKPSYSTENFTWFTQPGRKVTPIVDSDWQNDRLPTGFRMLSAQQEVLPDSKQAVVHLLYSDGLASVSVFIAEHDGKSYTERSSIGPSNSYSTVIGAFRVTAVGNVPAQTVEQIASSMVLR